MFDVAILKNPVVWIVGVFVVLLVVFLGRKSGSTGANDSIAQDNATKLALAQQSNDAAIQTAQIDQASQDSQLAAQIAGQKAQFDQQVSLASIAAQKDVALANVDANTSTTTLATNLDAQVKTLQLQNSYATDTLKLNVDNALHQSELDYNHDVELKNAENTRLLGLAESENKAADIANQLALGMSAIDANRYLTTLSINSNEKVSLDKNFSDRYASDNQFKASDLQSSRELTLAQIQGTNLVAAIKANKKSAFSSFLGGLGKGLGGGLTSIFGL